MVSSLSPDLSNRYSGRSGLIRSNGGILTEAGPSRIHVLQTAAVEFQGGRIKIARVPQATAGLLALLLAPRSSRHGGYWRHREEKQLREEGKPVKALKEHRRTECGLEMMVSKDGVE